MSAHILLNVLSEFRKSDKCQACRAVYRFFTMSLINFIIQEENKRLILLII